MRNQRWDKMKSPGASLRRELKLVSPSHAGPPRQDIDDALEVTVVMRTSPGIGLHRDGPAHSSAGASLIPRAMAAARAMPGI